MILAGKTALVTGAANRLGAQIARTLHQNGANLIIHYRNSTSSAQALEAELNALRDNSARSMRADLNDLAAIQTLAAAATQAFGALDILINNASSFYPTPIENFDEQDWNDLIGSNFKAPLFLAQACVNALRASQGQIINMLDIYASSPLQNHSIYCSAKAANQMLVKSLALELAPTVRVNGIAPGAILWPQQQAASQSDSKQMEYQQTILAQVPLQRSGTPDAITRSVLFLLMNDYITGEVIHVDGGRLLQAR